VHFNLAENRRDPNAPFAFMATYASQLSAQARVQHLPLGQALREYGGTANRPKLLSLLLPVQRAAETCAWLQPMISSGELFHPLRWSPQDAARLLASAAELERAGVVLRMPAGWQAGRPARPQVTATVGVRAPSKLGLDGLLDFSRPAVELERRLRAFTPWPGVYTGLHGARLKVHRARVGLGKEAPGTVLSSGPSGLEVACGEGSLVLLDVQLEGKRVMSAAEFLSGHKLAPGSQPFSAPAESKG